MKLSKILSISFFIYIITGFSLIIYYKNSFNNDASEKLDLNEELKDENKLFSFRYDSSMNSNAINPNLKVKHYLNSQGIRSYDSKSKFIDNTQEFVKDEDKIHNLMIIVDEYRNQHNYLKKYYDFLIQLDLQEMASVYSKHSKKEKLDSNKTTNA